MCNNAWMGSTLMECDYWPYEDYMEEEGVEKEQETKALINEILEHVYVTGNVQLFEDTLEELCVNFGVKVPETMPKFQKKRSELFDFAVQLTKGYEENLS